MADKTDIEWADATWSPITGCSPVDRGCDNCYAARLAATRLKHHPSRAGLARINARGVAKFNGEVRFNAKALAQPLRWRKPRMIFADAHTDLFHKDMPEEWIDQIFAIAALCPQHIFQILTKRPEVAVKYLQSCFGRVLDLLSDRFERAWPHDFWRPFGPERFAAAEQFWRDSWKENRHLPNVWIGTSISDQTGANERIPHLLRCPAAVRFVSAEPLLGPVDLSGWLWGVDIPCEQCPKDVDCECGWERRRDLPDKIAPGSIDQIIVGGESGPGARHWDGFTDACRSLRDQCQNSGTAFFMKQMIGVRKKGMPPIPDDLMIREWPVVMT